ncbi:MAG TPA: PAS domain S-box protein, partial [Lacibacter sp.]|nr:PAS domain S-box protein [Lacibacter sp.]
LVAVIVFFAALFYVTQREMDRRKRIQEELSDFNAKLKAEVQKEITERTMVFERITDAFVGLDTKWCYTYMNQKAGEIFQRNPAEMIGKHIWTEFPEGVGQPFHKAYERAMLNQEYIYFEEYYPPYNRWFENHIYPSPEGLSIFFKDITERKKSEQQLQETNQLLEIAEEQALLGSWHYDVKAQKGKWSKQMFRFFGLPYADEPPSFEEYLQFIHDDDRAKLEEVTNNMMQGKEPETFLYRTNERILPLRYLKANWYATRNANNEILKFSGTVMDVTSSKQAELAIAKERELSDQIINSLPGVFYLYNEQGRFLRWNENFESVTGYKAVEIAERVPLDFFPKGEQALLEQKIKNVFMSGDDFVEANFLTKAGDTIPYFFTGRRIEYNGEPCLLGVGINISEQRKAAELLAASEEKYRLLFADNPMPMWLYSVKTLRYIEVNEAAVKHYGYTREEFLKMTIKDIRPVEDVAKLTDITSDDYRGVYHVGQWRHLKKNGELIIAEIITHDTHHSGEHVRLVLSIDVTDKVAAEEKLISSLEQIRKLTAYLQDVREAERKRIGREIHDELGQQLTAIKMDVAWIDKKMKEGSPFKQKLNNINYLLDSSNQSIRKILTELRIGVLEHQNLQEAIQWLGNQFTETTGISLKLTMEDVRHVQEATSVCLFRVFQEGLTNITRYAEATLVVVSLHSNETHWVLEMKDNGKGFNTSILNKSKSFGILGMKERVHALNGEFHLESKPGEGTRIEVRLPKKTYTI